VKDLLPEAERFLAVEDAWADPERSRCVVIPVPYDETTSYGHGAQDGPAAILEASHQVEFFDTDLGYEPRGKCGGILTTAPLDVAGLDGASLAERLEAEAAGWIAKGKRVVVLGGEHTSGVGAAWASAAAYPGVGVLQLDAHSDLRAEYLGNPWSHACAMARVLDRDARLVQVGIRSEAGEERETVTARGIPVHYAAAIHRVAASGEDWTGAVVAQLPEHVHITFDCDVFDPAVMPSTGTPEPNGLLWRQVDALLERVCAERTVVSVDVTELAPIPGLSHPQFTVAKLVHRLIGRIFA